MEIRIDFEELERLQANYERSPEIVREELVRAVTEADLRIEREVQDGEAMTRATASGMLRASIFHEERIEGLAVEGFVGSPLNYVQPVELGTRPHFPPIEPLIDWVRTRFPVRTDIEARGIAFLVARKISRVGTKGKEIFGKSLAAVEPQLDAIFAAAEQRIAARITGAA